MAALNPCCYDIKTGVIVMTFLCLINDSFPLLLNAACLAFGEDGSSQCVVYSNLGKYTVTTTTTFGIWFDLACVIMCILVQIGAVKEKAGLIKLWYLYIMLHFYCFAVKSADNKMSIPNILWAVVDITYLAYILWVAQALINKIEADKCKSGFDLVSAHGFSHLQPDHDGTPPQSAPASPLNQQKQGQQPSSSTFRRTAATQGNEG